MAREEKMIGSILDALEDSRIKDKLYDIWKNFDHKQEDTESENSENYLAGSEAVSEENATESRGLFNRENRALKQRAADAENKLKQYREEYAKLKEQYDSQCRANEKLRDDNEQLKSQKENAQKDFKQLEKIAQQKVNELNGDINALNSQLQKKDSEIQSLTEKNAYYEKNYSTLDKVFQNYNSLDDDIIRTFDRVLNDEGARTSTAAELIARGITGDNVKTLWQVISHSMNNYENSGKYGEVREIYNYILQLYCAATGEYEIIPVTVGDEYNDMEQTRTSDSNVSGNIKEIVLDGYRRKNGDVVVKSKVVVE